uniref:Androgen-dependent TFPI-regulating protein n=1 Tax=Cacopsylla melanoneura TaxID=428564 RepID=A0A8D9ALG1_9HEMI
MVYQTVLHVILFAYEQFVAYSIYQLPHYNNESVFDNSSYANYSQDIQWAQNNFYRFYTNWNLMLQYLFIILLLVEDLLRLTRYFPKLVLDRFSIFNSYIFFSLVFPACVMVAATFWSIFWYDRDLIWPAYADLILPYDLNIMIHGVILVVVILILVTFRRPLPKLLYSMILLFMYNGAYGLLSLETYWETGHWVYEFQNQLELIWNMLIGFPQQLLGFAFLYIGRLLSELIHGEVVHDKNRFDVHK